jgi:hypothetical protein
MLKHTNTQTGQTTMTNESFTEAEVRESLDRALTVRDLSNRVIDQVEKLGYKQDSEAFLSIVQQAVKKTVGATAADERLLAQAEEARAVKDMLDPDEALRLWYARGCGDHCLDWNRDPDALSKAVAIAKPFMGADALPYCRERQAEALGFKSAANVGTPSQPVYVTVNPIINVPPPDASKKVISHGTDKYGEPNVTIETVPTTQN